MSKRCELQKEYYQANGNYKGNGKYCDKYVSWLEEQILALRIHLVSKSVCVSCDEETETHQVCMKCISKIVADNQQTGSLPDFHARFTKMDELCDTVRYIDNTPVKDSEQLEKLMKYDKWIISFLGNVY